MNRDNESLMNHHIRNLKNAVGQRANHTKYDFIVSQNELVDSYLHRMDDLGYPLRVESKRDRYVVNRNALQDALEHATVEAIKQMDKEITQWIDTDVSYLVESRLEDILNYINVQNNNFVVHHPSTKHDSTGWGLKFAERLGTALGKAIANIIDDTFFPKRRY